MYKKYKNILAPLDGSEYAECTIEHIKAIAKGCGNSEVHLLLVMEPNPAGVWETTGFSFTEAEKKSETVFQKYLSHMETKLKSENIDTRSVLLKGKAADSILDYAKKNEIDLIIMSTHGRSGPSRWAFGSVTDRVLRSSPVPVMAISPQGCRID